MTHPEVGGPPPDEYAAQYYDEYVLKMSDDNTARTVQRVDAVLGMLKESRGTLLTIGAGNLTEPLAYKAAGMDVTIADVATTQFERAERAGIKTIRANLDAEDIPGRFDVVSCLEVLEHLVNPLSALKRISSNVSPGGSLIVSLPEEFNMHARLLILIGKPPFSRHDWPHLRFFCLKSAREMLLQAGLEILCERHMPLVPPRWPRPLQGFGEFMARLLPSAFSISHVFRLRPQAAGGEDARNGPHRTLTCREAAT